MRWSFKSLPTISSSHSCSSLSSKSHTRHSWSSTLLFFLFSVTAIDQKGGYQQKQNYQRGGYRNQNQSSYWSQRSLKHGFIPGPDCSFLWHCSPDTDSRSVLFPSALVADKTKLNFIDPATIIRVLAFTLLRILSSFGGDYVGWKGNIKSFVITTGHQ